MFQKYHLEVIKKLETKEKDTDWVRILDYHKLMISRIQHERLIHLIVTVFVGICFLICFVTTIITNEILLGVLTLVLMLLFTAYIFHYRFLENTTQKWYKIEDQIVEKIKK